jgi:hypothetical protein
MWKYEALCGYLRGRPKKERECSMSLAEIEELVGSLPPSAQDLKWWFGADGTSSQTRAWQMAGWKVGKVEGKPFDRVIFIREEAESKHPTIDQAAIMGATLAAVITITISPGEFGPLDLVVGSTLLSTILAYSHLESWPESRSRVFFKCASLATAFSLCGFLILSWPLQELADHAHRSELDMYCDTIARDARNDCLGNYVGQHLTVWWLGITILAIGFLWRRWQNRESNTSESSLPAHGQPARVEIVVQQWLEERLVIISRILGCGVIVIAVLLEITSRWRWVPY